ncbi:hypothetical protein E8E12_001382 [Didymella heteroderae]|uniref:Uncharacterized protein n=1 Tax=Didymella heteroderae TaxID=1769908 RepID=A0A9P4WLH0_9PLEO|nr:hypothetical protein E8E12_001382 [Didymella heteroderae]
MCSANRFSILAGLNPSPETRWAFDFVPNASSGTRRRGKRGRRQRQLKHALKKKCEKPEVDGVGQLCNRFAALHLDDDAPAATPSETDRISSSGAVSDVDTVKHHWARQFRPNSLPVSNPTPIERADKQITSLSQKSTLDQGSSADARPPTRKSLSKFPLSAFNDLTTPSDWAGFWPPRNSTPEPAPPPRIPQDPKQRSARLLPTPSIPAGNHGSTVQSSNTAFSQSNAVELQRAVPTTSSWSTNALPAYKRSPAFGAPPFTSSSKPDPTKSRSSTLPLSLAPPVVSTSEGITVLRTSPTALITAPVTFPYQFVYPPQPWTPGAVPGILFDDTTAIPMSLRSRFTFSPDSPGRRVTREEFLAMGHDPECWCDSYKRTRHARDLADKAGASNRDPAYDSPESFYSWGNPSVAESQEAPNVRQSSRIPRQVGSELSIEDTVTSLKAKPRASSFDLELDNSRGSVTPAMAKTAPGPSLAPSPVVTPASMHVPYGVPELELDAGSACSDGDAVMVTPLSEGTDFGLHRLMTPSSEGAHLDFGGLEVIEGVPVDSDGDWPDDDWDSILDRMYAQQPSSSLTTHTVSDASVQTSNAPLIVSLPPHLSTASADGPYFGVPGTRPGYWERKRDRLRVIPLVG